MAGNHPQPAFQFRVEAGFARAGFTRVQLPRMERDVMRYREGGDPNEAPRPLPGLLRLGECVLERAVLAGDNDFFAWIGGAGGVERRDVVVTLLDAAQQPARVWKLSNAFPVALDWSVLDADESCVLIESLRLAVEAMTVQSA